MANASVGLANGVVRAAPFAILYGGPQQDIRAH